MLASERLEALRHLLYAPPTPEGWALICDLHGAWVADDPAEAELGADYIAEVARGWPDALRLAPRGWVEAELIGGAPLGRGWRLIRHLELEDPPMHLLRRMGESAWLESLSWLTIRGGTQGNLWARALARGGLRGLRGLALEDGRVTHAGLRALVHSELGARLESLSLSRNRLRPKDMRVLSAPGALPSLRRLTLQACGLGDEAAEVMASWPCLERLEALELRGNKLTYAGARRMATVVPPEVALGLEGNALRDENARALRDARFEGRAQRRLDELLARQPGAGAWQALCALLDAWPEDDPEGLGEAVGRAEVALDDWPDGERMAHPRWARELLDGLHSGQSPPARLPWRLVRNFDLTQARVTPGRPYYGQAVSLVAQAASTGALDHITALNLGGMPMAQGSLGTLARAPGLGPVRNLTLGHHTVTPEGHEWEAVATSSLFRGLEALVMQQINLERQGAPTLARVLDPATLRTLTLAGSVTHNQQLIDVLGGRRWERLERLALGQDAIGDEAVVGVARSAQFPALSWLSLGWTHVGPTGAAAMIEAMPALEVLDLTSACQNGPTPSPLDVGLLRRTRTSLKRLSMDRCKWSAPMLGAFLRELELGALEQFDASLDTFDDSVLAAMTANGSLRRLDWLGLNGATITDAGLEAMARGRWPALRYLSLGSGELTVRGLRTLLEAPALAGLTHLHVWLGGGLTRQDAAHLDGVARPPSLVALNVFAPGAYLETVRQWFASNPALDGLVGHAWVRPSLSPRTATE